MSCAGHAKPSSVKGIEFDTRGIEPYLKLPWIYPKQNLNEGEKIVSNLGDSVFLDFYSLFPPRVQAA